MPDNLVSHYRIIEKIGAGGMGVVHKAEDTKLGRTVALKFLPAGVTEDDKASKRFLHEAQAASVLDHPNICSIYEIDETDDGRVFIAMAYYEGSSLRERIEQDPLPVGETFEILHSIADGLAAAHDRGIVHRDIKPANIIITTQGYVKIVDFGLAKLAGRTRLTRTGATPGTLAYMSPEQVKGEDVDGRADIWSLGVLAYEALTGQLPFRGDIEAAMLYQIVNDDAPTVRKLRADIPQQFETIINKCLEKDPAERYQTAHELIDALVEMGRQLGWQSSGAVRNTMRVGQTQAKTRRPIIVGLVAVVAVVLALLAWQRLAPPGEGNVFTTEVRVAAMPIENLVDGALQNTFADGLSEWLVGRLQRLSGIHESMWATAFWQTVPGALITPRDAKDALGVNFVLNGTIQRYQDGHRLALELVDAETMQRVDQVAIDYKPDDTAVMQDVVTRGLAGLFDISVSDDAQAKLLNGSTSSSDAFLAHMIGLGLLQKRGFGDNLPRAVASIESAIAYDPPYIDAKLSLAMARLRQCQGGDDDQACDQAWRICRDLESDSTNVAVNLTTGYIGKWTDHREQSIAAYQRALAIEPSNAFAYRHMADNFHALDRFDEAEEAFVSMTRERPDYPESHTNLGLYYYQRDRIDSAIERYERVLVLAPNNSFTLNELGNIFLWRDEWSRARELFIRSFAIRPQCVACRNIGALFYFEGQFHESARYFKFALEYCDSTDANYYQLWQDWGAALYWVDGRREEAVDKFQRATMLSEAQLVERPDDSELVAFMAGCYAMLDDRDRALELLAIAETLDIDDPYQSYVIGHAFERLAIRESALHHISNAVRLGFSVPQIMADPLLQDLVSDIRFQQLLEVSSNKQEGDDSVSE